MRTDVAGHESAEHVWIHGTQPRQPIRAAVCLVRVASAAALDVWRVVVQAAARSPRRLHLSLSGFHLVLFWLAALAAGLRRTSIRARRLGAILAV